MNSEKQYTNLQMTLREVNRVGEGQKNVPKLRFKGYEDAWEQRKFMECINNVVDYRGKTPKKLGMNWAEEGFLALSALNVKDGYIDFELDANYGDIELYNAWMKQDLSKGQVVFTTEAPMGNVAQIPDKSKYILSQRVIAFEVAHEKITDDFLATLLKSPKVFDDLTSLATGGTAKGVSQKSLSKLSVKIPQIIEEQNKIAKIICTLNKAITLHQRKYDALKSMKKTLLSKMFPKNGEDVPEIRFKEFTDAWEQRKLGEVCERVVRKNKNYESDLPLTIASQFGLIDQRDFFGKIVAAKDMSNYYLLKKGEFAYNKSYSKGFDFGSIKRLNNYELGCLSTLYICFQIASNRVESDYLEVYFDTLNWYKDVMSICAEGARNHGLLNVDTKAFFEEVNVDIPREILEQKNIASSLEKVEKLITLHQRKLEELKNMKKTLLQQMFV